jgi:hypothetical protein
VSGVRGRWSEHLPTHRKRVPEAAGSALPRGPSSASIAWQMSVCMRRTSPSILARMLGSAGRLAGRGAALSACSVARRGEGPDMPEGKDMCMEEEEEER